MPIIENWNVTIMPYFTLLNDLKNKFKSGICIDWSSIRFISRSHLTMLNLVIHDWQNCKQYCWEVYTVAAWANIRFTERHSFTAPNPGGVDSQKKLTRLKYECDTFKKFSKETEQKHSSLSTSCLSFPVDYCTLLAAVWRRGYRIS